MTLSGVSSGWLIETPAEKVMRPMLAPSAVRRMICPRTAGQGKARRQGTRQGQGDQEGQREDGEGQALVEDRKGEIHQGQAGGQVEDPGKA